MFTAAEKTNRHTAVVQQKTTEGLFSRKAAEPFFGLKEPKHFFGPALQAKTAISSPDDPQEKEADAVAAKVMRMPDAAVAPQEKEEETGLQRKEKELEDKPAQPAIQAKSEPPEVRKEQEQLVQPKQTGMAISRQPVRPYVLQRTGRGPSNLDATFEDILTHSKGAGSALPAPTRQLMEQKIRADFSKVRIHTGPVAESLCKAINAQAFTHGSDIYFNSGKFAPGTADGMALLAHELTHTIQQGSIPLIQRKADASPALATPPNTSAALNTGVFNPAESIAAYVAEAGHKGNTINAHFGNHASGSLRVRKNKKGFYETIGSGFQALPLQLSVLQPLANAGITPVLAVKISGESKIEGFVTIATGKTGAAGMPSAVFDFIRKNPLLMNWAGMQNMLAKRDNIENKIDGDRIIFKINDISLTLGGFVAAKMNIGLVNSALTVEGNAVVSIKNLTNGQLQFHRDEGGNLKGAFEVQTNIKNFAGVVRGSFLNGIFDIQGKAAYTTDKLRGEINIIVTDARQARAAVLQQLEPQQIGQEAAAAAGANDVPAGPQPDPRVIAGWGVLDFAFNKWLTGSAKVIVDAEGHVTVHGEITPPATVPLFPAKPYRSPNFIDLHPKFRWGVPYVADVHIGLDFLLYAEAQIGPAVLKNIQVVGNYSTDPALFNDFRIQGTFNLIGYAALVFSFGAHAGVGILGFDIDLGGKVNAKAGIKGYVEATPVIGYREVADPVAGKKGEFFIKGTAELAAQPFLGLEGMITLAVDSPWPVPNFGHEWPVGKLEYPLPGQFGIGLTFGEYILGSGEWPTVDFNQVSFDPDKFADDLLEENVPPKGAHVSEKAGNFADKQKGEEVPPPPPVVEVPLPKQKGKKGKVPKKVVEKAGAQMGEQQPHEKYEPEKAAKIATAIKELHALEAPLLTNGKLSHEEALKVAREIKKAHSVFTSLTVVDDGDKWDYEYTGSSGKISGRVKDMGTPKASEYKPSPLDENGRATQVIGKLGFSPTLIAAERNMATPSPGKFLIPSEFKYNDGHLLPHSFGGPDNDPRNLAAISVGTNRQFSEVEGKVRRELQNNQDAILQYQVECEYAKNGPSELESWMVAYYSTNETKDHYNGVGVLIFDMVKQGRWSSDMLVRKLNITRDEYVEIERILKLKTAYFYLPNNFTITVNTLAGNASVAGGHFSNHLPNPKNPYKPLVPKMFMSK